MNQKLEFTLEMEEYVKDLADKAVVVCAKTEAHSNVHIDLDSLHIPLRVDDHQLLYIGCRLLPNIVNYLLNIFPQFLYPYVVCYLQNLSEMREDPITINELFDYLNSLENGNILDSSKTES